MTTSSGRTFSFPATAALLLTSALLLTGCGSDEPVPKFAPAPTATSTAMAEHPPVEEESAQEEVPEKESAEEFIRRWNDEQREMQKGDTSGYREIAAACKACMKAADQIDEIYAAGGFVKTDGRTVRSISAVEGGPNVKDTYLVEVDSAPTVYRESSQTPKKSLNGGVALYELRLSKTDGRWAVLHTAAVPR